MWLGLAIARYGCPHYFHRRSDAPMREKSSVRGARPFREKKKVVRFRFLGRFSNWDYLRTSRAASLSTASTSIHICTITQVAETHFDLTSGHGNPYGWRVRSSQGRLLLG